MAVTLLEQAKLMQDQLASSIVEEYAENSDILLSLPFKTIEGGAYPYNREDKLPGIGFRGLNQAFDESTGVLNPEVEVLKIAGGDLDVDVKLVSRGGQAERTVQESMKLKSLAHAWTRTFIKGDAVVDPRGFDGLQKRLVGSQLLENADAGGPLSLSKLDEVIDQVNTPTGIICSKAIRRRLTQAARNTAVGGFITYDKDAFGRRVTQYNDLPLIIADEDEEGNQILPFAESAKSGGNTFTSLYVVSFSDTMLFGIQGGEMEARDLGEIDAKPVYRTRVEWDAGFVVQHGKSAARLRGISDAAVVV